MKKIIIILLILISGICSFSQNPIKLITYKNSTGNWSELDKKYMYDDYVYSTITFSFYDTYIGVNDKNNSIYRITENLEKIIDNNSETVRCKAMDESNKNCLIYLTSFKDCNHSTITIFYPQSSFFYIIDK